MLYNDLISSGGGYSDGDGDGDGGGGGGGGGVRRRRRRENGKVFSKSSYDTNSSLRPCIDVILPFTTFITSMPCHNSALLTWPGCIQQAVPMSGHSYGVPYIWLAIVMTGRI